MRDRLFEQKSLTVQVLAGRQSVPDWSVQYRQNRTRMRGVGAATATIRASAGRAKTGN